MTLTPMPTLRFDSALEERVYYSLISAGIDVVRGDRRLPGNPDFVWNKTSTAVFVHGCYWHRHTSCRRGRSHPVKNALAWDSTFSRTVARDSSARRELRLLGWNVVILWECRITSEPSSAADAVLRAETITSTASRCGGLVVV